MKNWHSSTSPCIVWESIFHQVDEKLTLQLITIWDQLSTSLSVFALINFTPISLLIVKISSSCWNIDPQPQLNIIYPLIVKISSSGWKVDRQAHHYMRSTINNVLSTFLPLINLTSISFEGQDFIRWMKSWPSSTHHHHHIYLLRVKILSSGRNVAHLANHHKSFHPSWPSGSSLYEIKFQQAYRPSLPLIDFTLISFCKSWFHQVDEKLTLRLITTCIFWESKFYQVDEKSTLQLTTICIS